MSQTTKLMVCICISQEEIYSLILETNKYDSAHIFYLKKIVWDKQPKRPCTSMLFRPNMTFHWAYPDGMTPLKKYFF